jgi:hypothetical protein
MHKINWKRGSIALLGLGAAAVTAVAPIGDATAKAPANKAAVVTIEGSGKDLAFDAPETVQVGQELEIVNNTSPKKDGPHTFSLVKRKFIPQTKEEMKKCKICGPIAQAHKAGPEGTGKVSVDKGEDGWDKQFTDEKFGDSWYTEAKNDSHSRLVTADAGKKLGIFCAIHPFMSGKIEVVK